MVKVLSGKDRGVIAKVLRVYRNEGTILVEGVNFVKRHTKPHSTNMQGGIVEKEAPLDISSVMLICSKCSKPTRIGKKVLEDGTRQRVCKKCGEVI